MPDAHGNLAYSLIVTAPSPADTGTSLVVTAGQGTRFPATPFNATIWPAGPIPAPANAEIVRVTTVSTDTLTITRAQESTTARSVIIGDKIANTVTVKTLTDVETDISNTLSVANAASNAASVVSVAVATLSLAVSALSQATSVADAALSVRADTLSQAVSVISQQVSVLSQTASVHSQRWSTLGGGAISAYLRKTGAGDFAWEWGSVTAGGTGSVTSGQRDVLSNQISVLSLRTYSSQLTGAVSVSGLISTDNRISNALSVVSQAVSVVSTAASNALSVANAASNAASVVSQALSVLSQAASVADAALSVRIDTQSQGISVLSQQVSALSQAR